MKLLTNAELKFLSWNVANILIFFAEKNVSSFCIAKASHFFCCKNINVSENTLAATSNEFVFNELFKQVKLWTTGPDNFAAIYRSKVTFGDRNLVLLYLNSFKKLWLLLKEGANSFL